MIALEMVALVVMVILALRLRPPERGVSPRILSLLAGVATVAFGIAMAAIVIVVSELVFGIALLIAGITGCVFLWLARGGYEDDDDDEGDEPPADPPEADPDGGLRRFARKRTRAPAGSPTRSPGGVR